MTMSRWLRRLFAILVLRPVAIMMLGMTVRGRENLPTVGPAIVIANHNSHLDTLVLLSLMPYRHIDIVRPVAAADYFLKQPVSRLVQPADPQHPAAGARQRRAR